MNEYLNSNLGTFPCLKGENMDCIFQRPFSKFLTSFKTYKIVGFDVATAVAINVLAATLLGKSKTQAALLGASSSLLMTTCHFTQHRFGKSDDSYYNVCKWRIFAIGQIFSGLIIASAHHYFSKTPYFSWSTLSLTVAPLLAATVRNGMLGT